MIKPTIGRVVWFWPFRQPSMPQLSQPQAAIITYVHSDRMVNLSTFDPNGIQGGVTSVPLYQNDPNEERPQSYFCEWMPYQQGQAAKTEALEKQLGEQKSSEPSSTK